MRGAIAVSEREDDIDAAAAAHTRKAQVQQEQNKSKEKNKKKKKKERKEDGDDDEEEKDEGCSWACHSWSIIRNSKTSTAILQGPTWVSLVHHSLPCVSGPSGSHVWELAL